MTRIAAAVLALAVPLAPAAALADAHVGMRVTGVIVDREGAEIGSVEVFETASGVVRVNVAASPIPAGGHGVHFHEIGECEGDFTSAGEHIAGGMEHGLVEGGPHPGDMPNGFVEVEALNYETFNAAISVGEHLLDEDGAALMIHSAPDDYESQPSGDAGDRIACAVLQEAPAG